MTVNSKSPVTGPLVADGVNNAWAFDFKVREVSHMHLKVSDADGSNEELITSGITIAAEYLNNDSGGYAVYSGVIAAGRIVYAVRAVPYVQQMRIGNQGQFWPQTHEDALDYLAMQIQQLVEMIGRAPMMPVGTDAETLADVLSHLNRIYNSADAIDEVAAHMPAIENAVPAAAAAAASATSSAGSAAAAAASAASIDVSSFYTKTQIDGFRTTDQNAAKNASNLSSGTVPDDRLPERLQAVCKTITDWNDATYNGWYMQYMSEASALTHAPMAGQWSFGIVIAHQTQWLEQRVTVFTAEEYGARPVYVRWRIGGVWTAWQRVYGTAAEIQSIVPVKSGSVAVVSLTGATSTEVLSLPANIRVLNVDMVLRVGGNQGYQSLIQLGDASAYAVSGYQNSQPGSYPNSVTAGIDIATGAEAIDLPISVRATRLTGNLWAYHVLSPNIYEKAGTVTLSGELTRLKYVKTAGVAPINNSQMKVSWEF